MTCPRCPARALLSILWVALACSDGATNPERPPEPVYRAEEVRFASDGLMLEGTLLVPTGAAAAPAIVIVAGSGPVNRDGIYLPAPNLLPPIYRRWAERMASEKMVVLRYDKRFITHRAIDPLALSQEDQVSDIVAAVSYLERRPEVDAQRIFVVGHSEGASIAPVAASRASVRAVVGAAALAFAVDSLVLAQLRASPDVPPSAVAEAEQAFRQLREGTLPAGSNILGAGPAYWREWIRFTERADSIALALGRPMLVVQGLADENFPGSTLEKNVRLWEAIASRSPLVELRTYPGVTHDLLSRATQGDGGAVVTDIIEWLRTR
ncbi:MAG: alpha/beta hydrolase family protein [Gemmatimonadaceae bacterium]